MRQFSGLSLALVLGVSAPVFAQTQTSAGTETAPIQEIVVTGSRIPQPNLTSTSPIQVVASQEIRQEGITDMSSLLNLLPQNFQNAANDLGNNSNPLFTGGGVANVDLRGLGPQRTLVLVDGRRLGPGDPNTAINNPGADIDQIPVALVERVEVVTGGASATYGSDAIAGVVNFIMKKNFQGLQIDGQLGVNQHDNHDTAMQNAARAAGFSPQTGSTHDGQSKDFSLLAGTNIADGKGNITAYLEYRHALPVLEASRDFATCQLLSGLDSSTGTGANFCSGSRNSNRFKINGAFYSVVGNQLLPYPQAGSSPSAIFNTNPYEDLSRADERYNAGFMAHVDYSSMLKPYFNFSFMEDKTTTTVAPSGLFGSSNAANSAQGGLYLVNCSNPLLSAQERSILCTPGQIAADTANPGGSSNNPLATNALLDIGRRNIEGGPRTDFFDHTNYRVVIGSTGELVKGWTYDAYGQYYYTSLFNSNDGYLDYSKINNGLQVTTGKNGKPICISGGNCVPYDIWNTGGVTPDQTAYLTSPGTGYGSVTERILHADITGDLAQYGIKSPFADDAVGVNLGYEHRSDHLDWAPDEAELQGNLSGFSGAIVPIHNGYAVSEGFIEARAALAQNQPFIKDLSFDTGYRYSHYSTAGATNAYKFEVQYAPVDDVRLRASFERAIRAPNVIELFSPAFFGQSTTLTSDPCAGANPVQSLANCMRTGVTPAQYGHIDQCPSQQCDQTFGGNSSLKPEKANTYTVGLTFTPTFLTGFSASVDYYSIDLKDEISQVPLYTLNQCLATGASQFCNQVVRNPLTGALVGASIPSGGYVVGVSENLAKVVMRGIDVQSSYRYALPNAWGMSWGSLSATFSGTYLLDNLITNAPGFPTFNCAGLFGPSCNSTVNPRWRHNLRVNWETPFKVVFSAQWRFIGKTGLDNNDPSPGLFGATSGALDPNNAEIPSISYIDLSAIYNIYEGITIRAGVNNVLDKDPPIIATDYVGGAGTPNAFPTYDLVGRQAFLGFTAKF